MTCNILLVGYGAVGTVIAYALEKTGKAKVTAVARSNYQIVSEGKMNLKSDQYGYIEGFKPSRVVQTVAEAADSPYDFVLITTKAIPELYPTSKMVAPLLSEDYKHPQPIYVLMQNGLGVEKDLHAALQANDKTQSGRIVTGAIEITTNMIGDTVYDGNYSHFFFGNFYQGENDTHRATKTQKEALERLIDILSEGGCESKVDPYVQAAKFRKNLWNASVAMFSCLTRTSCTVFFTDELACKSSVEALLAITSELVAVGKALGHPDEYLTKPTELVEYYRVYHTEDTSGLKPSTLLDVEAGRPFELEVILGEVVRMGTSLNIPIPTLTAMYNALNIVQRQFVLAATKKN